MPTPAEIKEREAYDAWVGFYYHLDGREYRNQHEEDEREAELFRQYGEAPMWALIIPRTGNESITRESAAEFYEWMDEQAARREAGESTGNY